MRSWHGVRRGALHRELRRRSCAGTGGEIEAVRRILERPGGVADAVPERRYAGQDPRRGVRRCGRPAGKGEKSIPAGLVDPLLQRSVAFEVGPEMVEAIKLNGAPDQAGKVVSIRCRTTSSGG